MAEVEVKVGGRIYTIACDPGEELEVQAAANELNTEAEKILGGIGKVPEVKLLLMAGLMLGGRLRTLDENCGHQANQIKSLESQLGDLMENVNTEKSESHSGVEGQGIDSENCERIYLTTLKSILDQLEDLLVVDSKLSEEPEEDPPSQAVNIKNSDQKELF